MKPEKATTAPPPVHRRRPPASHVVARKPRPERDVPVTLPRLADPAEDPAETGLVAGIHRLMRNFTMPMVVVGDFARGVAPRPAAGDPLPSAGGDRHRTAPFEIATSRYAVSRYAVVPDSGRVGAWGEIVRDADGPGARRQVVFDAAPGEAEAMAADLDTLAGRHRDKDCFTRPSEIGGGGTFSRRFERALLASPDLREEVT